MKEMRQAREVKEMRGEREVGDEREKCEGDE